MDGWSDGSLGGWIDRYRRITICLLCLICLCITGTDTAIDHVGVSTTTAVLAICGSNHLLFGSFRNLGDPTS